MHQKKKSILITGAGGFIGANLTRQLEKDAYDVHITWKSSSNPWRLQDISRKLTFHEVSLLDRKKLEKIIELVNPSAIFHLAARGAYPTQKDIEQIMKTNIYGLMNLLLASKNIQYDIFVNTGSSSEYGIKKGPMQESDTLEPISFYGVSKVSATLFCKEFAREYNKPIVTFRPFSVYGPFESSNRFIPTIIRALINKNPIRLTPGSQRRDFIHVEDVVHAYLTALKMKHKLMGKICNVGSGKEYTNDEVVKMLFKKIGHKVPIMKGSYPKRRWDTSHWVAGISHTTEILGWKPRVTLAEGLEKTYDWFTKNIGIYEKGSKPIV